MWEFFQTRGNKRQGRFYLDSIRVKAVFVLFACSAKAFGVAFCYKDCFGEPHLRLRSAMARRLDDCRGSRVGCFREIAGGTPATTALLWREGGDVHTKKRF